MRRRRLQLLASVLGGLAIAGCGQRDPHLAQPSPQSSDTAPAQSPAATQIERLLQILSSPEEKGKEQAAQTLSSLKDPSKVPDLLRLLRGAPDSYTRCLAANVLTAWGEKSAAPDIVPLLEEPIDPIQSAVASTNLILLDNRSVLRDVEKLLHHKDFLPRLSALNTLGGMKDPSSGAAVAESLSDPEPLIRQQAAESLGMIAGIAWTKDESGIQAAKAWWATHGNDPQLAPSRPSR